MTDTPRDWADEKARDIVHRHCGSPDDLINGIAKALRAVRAMPGCYAGQSDVLRCSVDISVAQAASFAGGIDEFVRLSMEQAGSSMADRIRTAAEAAKGGG